MAGQSSGIVHRDAQVVARSARPMIRPLKMAAEASAISAVSPAA